MAELGLPEPDETGETFAENSAIKAMAGAQRSGLLTLADDSGLKVDALGGAPGVRSARYAGETATDSQNVEKLLRELSSTPTERRSASFVCVLTLAQPAGVLSVSTGSCDGSIGFERRGTHGFGYDPVFVLPDGRTMAELPPEEKNLTSHRGIALRDMLPALLVAIGTYRFAQEP